jgi:hypothetical protein
MNYYSLHDTVVSHLINYNTAVICFQYIKTADQLANAPLTQKVREFFLISSRIAVDENP